MNKTITIIVIFISFVLFANAGYNFSLSQYEEECMEYKIDSWDELRCRDWHIGYDVEMFNKTHKYRYDYWSCDEYAFWYRVNITVYNTTNQCLKYHLVRKT